MMMNMRSYPFYRVGFVVLLFISLHSCRPIPNKIVNLNEGNITSIGHGGPGIQSIFTYVPVNTMEGFRKAFKNPKLDGVEMDIQMSSDGKLILFHDDKLSSKIYQNGKVIEHTYSQLLSYTYATTFYNFSRGNYHLAGLEPTLVELKKMRPNGVFVLDLKLIHGGMDEGVYQQQYAQELVQVLHRTNTTQNVCIESLNHTMLQRIQAIDSSLKLFLYTSNFDLGYQLITENHFYGITIKHTKINKEQVEKAHQKGIRVSIWGPRSAMANTKAICMQPDYIQTDKINNLVNKLARYSPDEHIP